MDFLAPGLHRISADRYHSDPMREPSLSSTLARLMIGQSPLHAWTASPRLNPNFEPKDTKVFDIGRGFHREVLGAGEEFLAIPEVLLAKNGAASTTEAKAFIEECRAAGITPVKAAEAAEIKAMADSARRCLESMSMEIDPAHSEIAVLAEIDDVMCRALIDNIPVNKPYLVDLKSTTDASPDACVRAVVNYGLDLQIAHYLDCHYAATGERRTMRLVFVEKAPPYEVGVVELYDGRHIADLTDPARDADWMQDAHEKARDARYLWRRCLDANRWPGYPRQVAVVGAPAFHRQKWAGRPAIPEKPSREAIAAAHAAQAPERKSA